MVKGVNKNVIEISDTGSEIFEKIVLYVSPKYGRLSGAGLIKAIDDLKIGYKTTPNISLRKRVRLRKKRIALLCLLLAAVVAAVVLIIVL